ncbi:hypothetical protein T439DRAFT_359520 [Meredithblackwellia eburnea MCA 4105]
MRFFFTLVALALAGAAQAKAGDWVTSKDGKFKIKTPTNASWARCETVHVEYIRVDGSDAEQQYWTMGIAGSRTPLVSGSIKGSGTILVPLTDLRLYKCRSPHSPEMHDQGF